MFDLTEDVDMATSLGERAQLFYDMTYASEKNVDKWLEVCRASSEMENEVC